MMVPEYYDRFAKFVLVDVQTNFVIAEGEEISINCPKQGGGHGGDLRGDGNGFGNDGPWN